MITHLIAALNDMDLGMKVLAILGLGLAAILGILDQGGNDGI